MLGVHHYAMTEVEFDVEIFDYDDKSVFKGSFINEFELPYDFEGDVAWDDDVNHYALNVTDQEVCEQVGFKYEPGEHTVVINEWNYVSPVYFIPEPDFV